MDIKPYPVYIKPYWKGINPSSTGITPHGRAPLLTNKKHIIRNGVLSFV